MIDEPKRTGGATTARGMHASDADVALVGGHPVLDFANTIAWRTDPARSVERVTDAAAWLRWAARVGLLTPQQSAALLAATAIAGTEQIQRQLAALRSLRATLWAILDALVEGNPPPPQ